jgi:hypothetical protein
VKGKIAVQLTLPQGHMFFERVPSPKRAADLVAHTLFQQGVTRYG